MVSGRKKISVIDTLKFVAMLIVFNSHCDRLHPVPALATGGAIGNSLFFIISGFLLHIRSQDDFFSYMWRRIVRMYPIVFCANLVYYACSGYIPRTSGQILSQMIWPTPYWFIGAILIFYALIWELRKAGFHRRISIYSGLTAVIYFIIYAAFIDKTRWSAEATGITDIAGGFKCIHYFYIFSIGYCIRERISDGDARRRKNKSCLYMLAAAFGLGFMIQLALKYCMAAGIIPFSLQFISHLCDICCAVSALLFSLGIAKQYEDRFSGTKPQRFIEMLSAASLEIYCIQFLFIDLCVKLPFPVNIPAAFAGTSAAALMIRRLIMTIRGRLSPT